MTFRHTRALLLLAALGGACVTDPTDEATSSPREATGPLVGRAIELALEPGALDHDAIEAFAKHIEVATGAESVRIEVRESGEEGTVVVVEAWGRAAITDEALVAGLRQQFPAMKNALIAVEPVAGDGPAGKLAEIDVDPDDDPEEVRRRVLEQLRADGVQGDVKVHVEDDDDGRREVRVEVEDRKHE